MDQMLIFGSSWAQNTILPKKIECRALKSGQKGRENGKSINSLKYKMGNQHNVLIHEFKPTFGFVDMIKVIIGILVAS